MLKRGLGTGVQRLQDQLRRASRGEQAEERPEDKMETVTTAGVHQAIRRLQKLLEKRKQAKQPPEVAVSTPHSEESIQTPIVEAPAHPPQDRTEFGKEAVPKDILQDGIDAPKKAPPQTSITKTTAPTFASTSKCQGDIKPATQKENPLKIKTRDAVINPVSIKDRAISGKQSAKLFVQSDIRAPQTRIQKSVQKKDVVHYPARKKFSKRVRFSWKEKTHVSSLADGSIIPAVSIPDKQGGQTEEYPPLQQSIERTAKPARNRLRTEYILPNSNAHDT